MGGQSAPTKDDIIPRPFSTPHIFLFSIFHTVCSMSLRHHKLFASFKLFAPTVGADLTKGEMGLLKGLTPVEMGGGVAGHMKFGFPGGGGGVRSRQGVKDNACPSTSMPAYVKRAGVHSWKLFCMHV
jgi:hypothetical protein